jgi:cystathionine beta-lyase/cystathionine gamma-synthase
LLAVDNTFLTPVGLRPLDLGADISVYSTTKYIEGHNATVGGSLTSREVGLNERFRFIRKSVGSIQAPQDAWLTLRGIKTLPVRLRQHTENAQVVAEWLEGHPAVERVWYPGLRSFPQYELARRQHRLHSGILSFELKGGTEAGVCVLNSVRLISLAESLGAVESLITHPVTMTHGSVPKEERLAVGITDGLIRLSVGLEDPKDLIADLEQALARVTGGETRRVASVGGAAW